MNRLTTVTANSKNITYDYYPSGMIKSKTFPAFSDGTELKTEFEYDNAMRLKTLTNKKDSDIPEVLSSFSYEYDGNGNISSITTNGQQTDYVYDELNRLIEIHKPDQTTVIYQYDTRGNRILVEGQETPEVSLADYQFDAENRLVQAKKDNRITTFEYDPTGMRVKKKSTAGTEKYVYDQKDRIVAITDNANNVKYQIVWGPDVPLMLKDIGANKLYYYVSNGHGDVSQLIDQQGNIANEYAYDEWGNILSKTETVKNILKYASEPLDDETGLYYLRARYYDPVAGRFINEDTYVGQLTNPLSLNMYTYCYNNPIIYADPTGHWVESDSRFSTTVQAELLKLTLAWLLATSDEDRNDIHNRAEEIREKVSSGIGQFLDKAKSISGAAADELSWFLGGDVSRAERDYWLSQVQKYNSNISIDEKTALNGSMFIIGMLAPSPDDALKMISKKASKEMFETVGEKGAKKFLNAMTKYARSQGDNGIKALRGNGIKGYI